MKSAEFGIQGEIHPKDESGFMGAAIPEIGLFTQAKNQKELVQSIKDAFFDLFEKKMDLNVTVESEGRFILSSTDVTAFYALILKGVRGDRSFREASRLLNKRSTSGLQRYENGETTPSLETAIDLLSELGDEESDHLLVWMPKEQRAKVG